MSSPSLRPLIDTCQKCSTSPANHEPRSPANGSFQNPGVCPQAVPSFSSPTPTVLFLALAPFSAQAKYRKPRSSVFLCSQTLRKRLLRRLSFMWWCQIIDWFKFETCPRSLLNFGMANTVYVYHSVHTLFQKHIFRTFPGLRLIFQGL